MERVAERVVDGAAIPAAMPLIAAAKRLMHRLLAIGENRLHLLVVEVQEERDRLVDMVFMAVITAALGMLFAIAWSAAIVVFFWQSAPVMTLVVLGGVYAICAALLCRKMLIIRRGSHTLAATLDQFRKDRACLKKN